MAVKAQKVTYDEVAAPSTPAAGEVVTYAKADGLMYSKDDAGTETAMSGAAATAHIADASDAHDASAVSFDATGLSNTSATEVQTALEDFDAAIDAAGGGAAELLAVVQYNPATTADYTTVSGTMADMDATNAIITFTAPASGNVIVELEAFAFHSSGAVWLAWGLRESTTDIGVMRVTSFTGGDRCKYSILLTGISAGSHSYKWSHGLSGGASGTGHTKMGVSDSSGPGLMKVWAAP